MWSSSSQAARSIRLEGCRVDVLPVIFILKRRPPFDFDIDERLRTAEALFIFLPTHRISDDEYPPVRCGSFGAFARLPYIWGFSRSGIHSDPEQMASRRGLIDSCKTANVLPLLLRPLYR
jgi:hypothetical protein